MPGRHTTAGHASGTTVRTGQKQSINRRGRAFSVDRVRLTKLLGGGEGEGLQDPRGHRVDERHSVGHDVVPLGMVPGGLATGLPVRHGLVAP